MKQINVTFYVDDQGIQAEAGGKSLAEAIAQSLHALRNNRLYMEKWDFMEPGKEAPESVYEVPTPPLKKVSCLCEEFEGTDGIREFEILAVSEDIGMLRELMQQKIQDDEYGMISQNGVSWDEEDHFSTEFDCGFVEYYICEKDVLSREAMSLWPRLEAQSHIEGDKAPLSVQIAGAKQSQENNPGRQAIGKQTEQERG